MASTDNSRVGPGSRPGSSDDNTRGATNVRTPPRAKTKNGNGKRLACDNCRERKVRCNREQPMCGRCARLGHNCRYTAPVKQQPSQMDVSRLLFTLHSRLAQTEARLAINPQPFEVDNATNGGIALGQADGSPLDFLDVQQQRQQGMLPDMDCVLDDLNMDEQLLHADMDTWGNIDLDNDAGFEISPEDQMHAFTFPLGPPASLSPMSSGSTPFASSSDEEIPLQTLKILHYAYFDIAHLTMPIVNQDHIARELENPDRSPQVASLSYAMATLGASLMDGYSHTKDRCYQLSRKYLEVCEREEDGNSLVSIEALQACILIAYYELRGKGFARAWMTLGRAIRLAQMMGLDRMDSTGARANGTLQFQQTLPPAQSEDELEQRRKTFWVLFIMDAYASVRSGSAVAIDGSKVTTSLPTSPTATQSECVPMPSLGHASRVYGTGEVPSFTGLVLMVQLYRRCLGHIRASVESDLAPSSVYSFWEHHYTIDKDLQSCSNTLLGKLDAQALLDDDFALALNLNLCAIDICLHEAAILRAQQDSLPLTLVMECKSRCYQAAARIAEGISLSQKLVQPKRTLFKQMNIYCMWPVCMAIQVLDRQLPGVSSSDCTQQTMGLLKLLVAGIRDMEDTSGHWLPSIEQIAKRVDEMDQCGNGVANAVAL